MQKFSVVITTLSGSSIPFTGQLVGRKLDYDQMTPADHAGDSKAAFAVISTPGNDDVVVPGSAWEELEANGLLEQFLRLSLISPASARVILQIAETGVGYHTIVTCDASISCCVLSATNEKAPIVQTAMSTGAFELDEGNYRGESDYYDNDSTEEIGLESALVLMLKQVDRASAENRATGAMQLVESLAALKKIGEPDDDGTPFEPEDGINDSHACLMSLIDQARELVE